LAFATQRSNIMPRKWQGKARSGTLPKAEREKVREHRSRTELLQLQEHATAAAAAAAAAGQFGLRFGIMPPMMPTPIMLPPPAQPNNPSMAPLSMKRWRGDIIGELTKESHADALQKLNAAAARLGLDFHQDPGAGRQLPPWHDVAPLAARVAKLDFGRIPLLAKHADSAGGPGGSSSLAPSSRSSWRQLCICLRNARAEPVLITELMPLPESNPHFEWHYAVGQGLAGPKDDASAARGEAPRAFRALQVLQKSSPHSKRALPVLLKSAAAHSKNIYAGAAQRALQGLQKSSAAHSKGARQAPQKS
jgi:hypothetical protein